MRWRRLVAPLLVAFFCAGCGALQVDAYPTEPQTQKDCAALYNDVPPDVAGAERQRVDDDLAVAWGDPAIIMRCGVEKPEAMTPSSRCDEVEGIGWFTEDTEDGYLFTTVGRQYYISIEVPSKYDPAADVLVDLADAVGRHDPEIDPCV